MPPRGRSSSSHSHSSRSHSSSSSRSSRSSRSSHSRTSHSSGYNGKFFPKKQKNLDTDFEPDSFVSSSIEQRKILIGIVILLVLTFTRFPFGFISWLHVLSSFSDSNDDSNYYNNDDSSQYHAYATFGTNVYVPEIDRTCSFDKEYYYDSITDCYFYYNNETDVPQIQYWYEDFSSDYGDYGWLEYDEYENQWYVEVGYNKWEIVNNVPNYFWHTSYESLSGIDTSNQLPKTIYVSAIDRYCTLDGEDYYDRESDCYFYLNNTINPPQIQYWYEGFSSNYGDYGWLEYDENENQWYVEVDYGQWEVVENPPDYFWHTSYEKVYNDNFKFQ